MNQKNQERGGCVSADPHAENACRPKGSLLSALAIFALLLLGFPSGLISQETAKSIIELKIKDKKIKAEVVRTEADKARGLMFRQKLGKNEGMLFVYEREERLPFWMKNTPIPLSIAFLDKTGMIVDIQDLVPFSLQTRVSAFPAQYALEVNQGWFQANGIAIGDSVAFPPGFER
jgi:uncharacterized membrane protein (UPF0127 family)